MVQYGGTCTYLGFYHGEINVVCKCGTCVVLVKGELVRSLKPQTLSVQVSDFKLLSLLLSSAEAYIGLYASVRMHTNCLWLEAWFCGFKV